MALPGILTAVLGAGQSLYNTISQNDTNDRNEKFTREMYEQQKNDALSQWHLQNDYNSPRSQMVRLESAGLNPNLVYGNGATMQAAPLRSPSPQSNVRTAPQSDMGNSIMAYANVAKSNAEQSNLQTQNTLLANQAALTAATTAGKVIGNSRDQFELDKAKELRKISVDTAAESLRQMTQQTGINLGTYQKSMAVQDQNITESVQRIMGMALQNANTEEQRKQIQAQTQQILSSTELQKLDIELKRNGIQPSDPIYLRALGRIIPPDLLDKVQKQLNKKK